MKLIRVTNTRMLNFKSDIFNDYPDKDYIRKLLKLNRLLIQFFDEGKLIGILVASKKDKYIKINLVLAHPKYRREHIATHLMRILINILKDDFCDANILYTVCPTKFKTDEYQSLLLKCGFQLSTIKSNGELVYTYAKSIQESSR